MTECTQPSFSFAEHGRRQVVARFDGGTISSDGGAVLLRQLEQRTGIVRKFADCFHDYRQPAQIEHSVRELVCQRVYGLALGYEDLNDHDQLRSDPLLALLSGKQDLEGKQRRRRQDRGNPGAGKSTLNRLELTPAKAGVSSRYKKIILDTGAVDRLLTSLYIQSQPRQPERIVLDLDATDDALHGRQEGRFFHGYYGHYCYLPLYIFAGDQLLCARLRPANIDASAGSLEEVQRIVEQLRRVWPEVEILLRADSGFCRDEIMSWCEDNGVDYVFGLAKNERLEQRIKRRMKGARRRFAKTGKAARVFGDFRYRTRTSWARRRNSSTRRSTVPGERWRTASRSSRWGCSPTAPRRLYSVLIRSDYIFHRSDTVFWKRCGGWGWRGRRWRGRNARRSVCGCSRSERGFGSRRAKCGFRWRRDTPGRGCSNKCMRISNGESRSAAENGKAGSSNT